MADADMTGGDMSQGLTPGPAPTSDVSQGLTPGRVPIGPLVPVIVQDAETNRVLMLAYADDEALRRTRETGEAWFWSRSRQELWHKGATSGNTLAVDEIRDDCDGDAVLYRVRPNGPACHTGAESCFAPWLWRVIKERQTQRPDGSYVVRLLDEGPPAAARKVGEEGVEVALAGVVESDERLVEEIADLWFHTLVLLASRGLDPQRVEDELGARHSG
jgi:phosphoribosyl-ATP pyrophosphohydrolase/phosphoribosyl-AMP cyclohydrolase